MCFGDRPAAFFTEKMLFAGFPGDITNNLLNYLRVLTKESASPTMLTGLGDGTHQKKQQAHTAKGRIPIEKNIIVVDDTGTVYESTWLKRANGLVKKGRARWLDEKTICLACPPEQMEDNRMENSKQAEVMTKHGSETENASTGGITLESLLSRMDAVRQEMLSMKELTQTMEAIANQGGEDDAGHIAGATSQAFIARETTCQQQLRFLEKVYNDHFSVPSEEAKTARTRMILDKMNDVISSLDYSDENGSGSIEALKLIKELYANALLTT